MSYSVPQVPGEKRVESYGEGPGAWPRWEVFVRRRGGLAHVHSESVHAPDAETALQNARDTYLRRVEGVGLWVIPAAAIARWEEGDDEPVLPSEPAGERRLWEAFIRHRRGATFLHAGSVAAGDAEEALSRAKAAYLPAASGGAVWVAPSVAVVAADPEEAATLFEPFADKGYRQATFYTIPDEVGHM